MKGLIFNIQRFCIHDGPGIRTTVFFKGCNLSCAWCHNPESQSPYKETMFYEDKCIGCGRCKNTSDFICPSGARELCGKEYSVNEVLAEVVKDKSFYENSGGGVTFSGGECMLQIDFLLEILKKCKKNGIHITVDTAGHIPWTDFEKIMLYTDLFLYDIKSMDSNTHKKYVGVGNELILDNLARLLKSKAAVRVRVPVIPSVNDAEEEMQKIKLFFDENGHPTEIELLPYHRMGEHKYESLGKSTQKFDIPSKEKIEILKHIVVPY
ncbi:MAG: glycyl-radical enzyme activating protein [Clostridia bacterium]|nr:glycyl-radical enzyme activating protein [Clostridia bacterium]